MLEATEACYLKNARQKGAVTKGRKAKLLECKSITRITIFHNAFSSCKFCGIGFHYFT